MVLGVSVLFPFSLSEMFPQKYRTSNLSIRHAYRLPRPEIPMFQHIMSHLDKYQLF